MIKKSLIIATFTTAMLAQTTMCFKKEWIDPSTIETTIMGGGKCDNKNSIEQMKEKGWSVDDIKISSGKTGMNFIYILKKGGMVAINNDDLETRLNKIQDDRELAAKNKKILAKSKRGEEVYKKHCISCHGLNGEEESYNTSRKINEMSEEEIKIAFRDYDNNEKDNGMAIIMKPYVGLVFGDDLDAVSKYIQTLK